MKKQSLIYPGAKIGVLGLGVTGRAAVRYCLQCGAQVFVSDCRSEEQFLREEKELLEEADISWEAGGHSRPFLSRVELLLISPGVDTELPLLKQLQSDGVRIAGELAVAAGNIKVPVVAVTGTNGKTTVTTLIGDIFSAAGKKAFVGGNIGTPLYNYLAAPGGYDIVVLEVSSFQLESSGGFRPDIGLLLNISPDHLDRHTSMENYQQAKMRLFANQRPKDVAIINANDPGCLFSRGQVVSMVRTFGTTVDSSVLIKENRIVLQYLDRVEEYLFDGREKPSTLTLKNYAAAILAARSAGCSCDDIRSALDGFRPLPHRLEFVAKVDGVSYYNDSKATNTGAVIGALAQFGGNVILLAGGRDKGDDYRLLRDSVGPKVKKLILLGESRELMEDALGDLVEHFRVQSMEEAVQLAADQANPGDAVLLSPACASFDMFRSYGHRGDLFKEAVHDLQGRRG